MLRPLAAVLLAATLLLGFAAPAGAQYGGGGISVFVTPTRLPVDQTFDVFGQNCAAGATVEISIIGVPGVLASGIADAGGFYSITDVVLPDDLLPGTDQTVEATCGPESGTAVLTLVCPSGDDPVDGSCSQGAGGLTGVPGSTTTTTVPGGGSGTSTDNPAGPRLAVTGASYAEFLAQIAVTMLGVGIFLVVLARRRRDDATV